MNYIFSVAAKMSGATYISSSLVMLSQSSNRSSNLSFSHCSFVDSSHLDHKTRGVRNPRTSICHGKLNSNSGGAAEGPLGEMEEAFYEDDVEEEEETESSLDLLFRLLQSMFTKASRRAKKATRSVLPPVIPPQLISFAVDGVLLLSSLSIVRAFLEVVCTLGGSVFVVILLLRVIWASVSHFQSSGINFSKSGTSYGTTQPVS